MAHGTAPPTNLRKLCPGIDPTLAEAIHGCLEADPERRLRTMPEFLETIKDLQSARS